ncbi:MAG: PadR family transcriptional regulator [Hyphomonas sp.]|uniref:PadR family transcriptional regulator n=1 Tax=Hyphomonas sp. TaxID=87 RepID=UPI00184A1F4B|nr:PadR family transcriptional regulator [Hyphomonas sp.]MBA3067840.1 PadR family transcriptional regulator [Hyphomonas sp.]MBU3922463.1 PadR family transcriptional regulator [Alphaproteobacteria bacterium]MBU4062396.1 PadR family transcriptional regulator [Alphaproteobacteria bacterium]
MASDSDWLAQWRRGALELCVLRILSDKMSYGYEIVALLSRLGPLAAGENTVYPLLRRLRNEGLLEAVMVESPKGPPRQYLQITAVGLEQLAARSVGWTELKDSVSRCLERGSEA